MSPYRGPDASRVRGQMQTVMSHNGETGTWRQYVSASTGTASGIYGGAGVSLHYREQTITGLLAIPKFLEMQYPGGQIPAGIMQLSTDVRLGMQDEIIWRGVTYRIESDPSPVHMGDRVWWYALLSRGDVTG